MAGFTSFQRNGDVFDFEEARRRKQERALEQTTGRVEQAMEARMRRIQTCLIAEGMPHDQALSLADRISDAIELQDAFWKSDIDVVPHGDDYLVLFLSERARQWAHEYLLPDELSQVDGNLAVQSGDLVHLNRLLGAAVWMNFRVEVLSL